MKIFILTIALAILVTGSIESDIRGVSAVPGEKLTFTTTVTNNFGYPFTFSLYYTAPEGFNGKFIFDGKEIKWLELDAGESKEIQFQLDVPEKAREGEYLVWINGGGSQSLRIDVHTPENPLEITPRITGIKIEAGDKTTIQVALKNKINTKLEVKLACAVPENWSFRFLDGGVEVYRIILEPNEEKSITFEVEADSRTAIGEYIIKPEFNEQFTTISAYITKTHEGEHGKVKLSIIGKDGKAVSFARIRSTGSTNEELFSSSEGEGLMELAQGKYNIEVSKEGFHTRKVKDVEVKAGKTTDLGMILLERKSYYANVVVSNPVVSYTLGAGKPLFEFRIENKGYRDDTYKLGADLPEDFYYRFKESQDSSESLSEIFVGSGESKNVYLEVLTPYNAKVGNYNLTLFVEGLCGTISKNLTLNLKGEFSLDVKPLEGRYLKSTEAGKLTEFKLNIANSGKGAAITNIKVDVEAPTGWKVSIEPEEIPAIQPGDSKDVAIKVLPPPDTFPNEYKIKINVKSDQTGVKDDFRVVVKESSYSPLVGILIILISLVSLGLIFRKFGRK